MVKSRRKPIGIMQGRLTPTLGRGIQFFPFDNWEKEFTYARQITLDEIEFIFDLNKFRMNPLWTKKGREKIIKLIYKSGVKVNNICADYFMRRPFFRVTKKIYNSNIEVLKKLVKNASVIGANLIVIPLLDNSSIRNKNEENHFLKALEESLGFLEKYNIRIGLESDLPPLKLLKLIKTIGHPLVGVNYDTGNSSSLGYDPKKEIETYGNYIINVHIKDRVYKGSTVMLGDGDVKFKVFFNSLNKVDYNGPFILQAARGKDGMEKVTIKRYLKYLSQLI
jgi:hexulose-6-phosphate isomerase